MPVDLVEGCIVARNGGADFPTVWETVLRRHWLVNGIPVQTIDNGRIQLEIRLITATGSSTIRPPTATACGPSHHVDAGCHDVA